MAWRRSRALVLGAAVAGALLASDLTAFASEAKHGLSAFGDLAYPADFQHFDYVNPEAPKAGSFSLIGWGGLTTFDSLNNYILKGDAAQGLELLFDTLMTRAADEPDAVYGLVASSAEVADDGLSVTFKLRPEAKFSDGSPLTADDVVFSFEMLKTKGHPIYSQMLADVVKAEALDPHTVRYTFKGSLVRDLPLTVAGLPIFSKAYYVDPRFCSDDARSAARLRPLCHRRCQTGANHLLQARSELLGEGPARQSRALELRRDPLRIFPRPNRRAWRASRPAPMIFARSSPPRSGPRNTTSPRSAPAR